MVGEKIMKKTLVVVLLILSVLAGCGKNTVCNNGDAIKLCSSSWGHYVYEYYDKETGVSYICTTDGGITPKVNSNGCIYESNR